MPSVYIKANQKIEVKWSEDGRITEWEDKEAEEICEQYGHPKCTIDLRIEDPNDPISPVTINIKPSDAIDGEINVNKISDKHYVFTINGIFKASIHKSGIPFIEAGIQPSLEGVTRFREALTFDEPMPLDWVFSTKKLK